MPFLLCCKEGSPVVINKFFFLFTQGPFQMSGPIKHNTTGLWVGKKIQLRGQRRKADLSCIFMLLVGSMTAVSGNCEQWQKKNVWQEEKSMLLTLFSPSPCPNVSVTEPQWQKLWLPASDSQNPNSDCFVPPSPPSLRQQIWAEKFSQ